MKCNYNSDVGYYRFKMKAFSFPRQHEPIFDMSGYVVLHVFSR